ncbi:MAG: hypothetical protein U1E40_10790 [Amaricoccus sp.]
MRPLVLAAALLLAATGARADAVADRLCPILEQVAADALGMVPEAVQANLVVDVGTARDHEHAPLMAVIDQSDAAAGVACPEARAAVLAALQKDTLAEAMRRARPLNRPLSSAMLRPGSGSAGTCRATP